MCISTKRSLKRSATAKTTASAITFSKPCILATAHHMNCVPRSNDLSILVDRVLRQYQHQQSSHHGRVVASKSLKSAKGMRVRFDASVKIPEASSKKSTSSGTSTNATLKTSQLILQVRIVLKILEKEDPHLRHRLVQSIDRCRRTLPKGRTFNRFVDALMRRMVEPETYQTATEARMRLAAAA